MVDTSFICEDIRNLKSRARLVECVESRKEYEAQPKNEDGSIRWFLYRWDDGKNGVRRLVKCKKCGALYLIQAYHLHKFSQYKDVQYEDWYFVESEEAANRYNEEYTGLQWELTHTPAIRCKDDEMSYTETSDGRKRI